MEPPEALIELVGQQADRPLSAPLHRLQQHLLDQFGEAIAALVFYGSCLRSGDDFDGLVDLYVLVKDYRAFYGAGLSAVSNRLLPPNVYYLEIPYAGRSLRAKYAVVSLRDFAKGTSPCWFHSYLWGRFTQPAAVLYARDEEIRAQVIQALSQAVVTFMIRVVPAVDETFTSRELWVRGLGLSYGAELRAERPERAQALYQSDSEYYDRLTSTALGAVPYPIQPADEQGRLRAPIPAHRRRLNRAAWRVRRAQGKLLSVLRLIKGLFTFRGGLDYILWKIERHSGVTVEVSPLARRHPLLASWGVFWRLYRRGAFR
jgi:hypothetical protein